MYRGIMPFEECERRVGEDDSEAEGIAPAVPFENDDLVMRLEALQALGEIERGGPAAYTRDAHAPPLSFHDRGEQPPARVYAERTVAYTRAGCRLLTTSLES
jgi:hypothetical protein